MSALLDKMRRAREQRVEAGGFFFTVRRPTDIEFLAFAKVREPVALLRFVVGWDRVNEIDLVPGGAPTPAAFDSDACVEWLSDRPDLFGPVVDAVIAAYENHQAKRADAEKN